MDLLVSFFSGPLRRQSQSSLGFPLRCQLGRVRAVISSAAQLRDGLTYPLNR
jgi:hypothetical protein